MVLSMWSIAHNSQHYCAESLTNVRRSWWRSWWSHCGCWGWQEDKKLVTCDSGDSVMRWGSHDRVSHNFIFTLCHSYTRDQTAHLLKIRGLTAFQLRWTCFWSCRIILTSWEWIVWLQKVTGVDHNLSLGVRAVIMMFVGLDFNNCWEMWLLQPQAQLLTSCVR